MGGKAKLFLITHHPQPLCGESASSFLAPPQIPIFVEMTFCGKMEIVSNYVQKNVAVHPEATASRPQGPAALLNSGEGTDMECAAAKYHALREAGVPAASMRVVPPNQGTLLVAQDSHQTLVTGSEYAPGIPMVRAAASLPPGVQPLFGADAFSLFTYSPA